VTKQTRGFAWILPLSATEPAPEPIYPSHILTPYCSKYILMLSSHQHSPFRYFNWTFPDILALRNVKQTSQLHLFNHYKQARIPWHFLGQTTASRCEVFPDVSVTISVPTFRMCWWLGSTETVDRCRTVRCVYLSSAGRGMKCDLWIVGGVKRSLHVACALYCQLWRAFHRLLSLSLLSTICSAWNIITFYYNLLRIT